MKDSNFTPWFSADVTPVRDGVYQVLIKGRERYSRWSKGQWHLALHDFDRARLSNIRSMNCYRANDMGGWRGLASKPKKA